MKKKRLSKKNVVSGEDVVSSEELERIGKKVKERIIASALLAIRLATKYPAGSSR